ncbi:FAD-dependent monooxygenase [Williamsia sp.]|uniref:FAD-dependent monooxygenase n=1 Tax=Williamsia sp. TaxID=1872085 RepID=UPI001A1D57DD|nr:FAD-dependent monooxygenase [Williamsia sp.]MBJ7289931.1 FAD-dependent monooxygenase [Williamsia sp.]
MSASDPVPVLIAGAGSTGATAALLLARRGIPTIIVDRRSDALTHPAAHVIHGRSLEIWREADPALAERIAGIAPPIESVNLIRWCSDLSGLPLGEIDLASRPEQLVRVKSHSDFLISHIGQHQLMPVLWSALDREPLIDFRRSTRVDSVEQHGDTVTATMSTGENVTARYVVGADGANSELRETAGIEMHGPVLARMGSAFFRAPGLYPADARPLLSWIYQPNFAGVMIAHADDHYVLMNTYLHPDQDVARSREAYWARTLPEVLGHELQFDIVSTGTWTMTSQTAEVFRSGRLLLAGDAAHRFPHTGGYGLNSGVQDAHNIAWKLDAVLSGRSTDRLLDTYEVERRPVINLFARHSVANHFELDSATKYFGVTNRMLQRATTAMSRPPMTLLPGRLAAPLAERITRAGLARTTILASTSWRAQRVRDLVAGNIPGQLAHFVSTGLEFGYRYAGPLVSTEPGEREPAIGSDDVVEYRPNTRPGGRLPHAVINTPDGPRSTLELVETAPTALTVFTFDPAGWTGALGSAADALSPLTTHVVDLESATSPATAIDLYEVGTDGAVVVRPDGHIIWRTSDAADAATSALMETIGRLWLPYFSRIPVVVSRGQAGSF